MLDNLVTFKTMIAKFKQEMDMELGAVKIPEGTSQPNFKTNLPPMITLVYKIRDLIHVN